AVWRGGFTKKIRIRLCEISAENPDQLDAKLVEDPARQENLKHLIGNRFSFEDFLNYKYLPNVTGTMASSPALQWRLLSNSVTLQQVTDEIQWFYRALKPYVHYVPVKDDLSDLLEQIQWSKDHDDLCKQIADNATEFALNNLMTEDIYLYFYLVLNRYSSLQHLSKEVEQETLKDPRWAKIQSRKAQKKKAKAEGLKGYNRSFTPF
ncbi:MAG TPA: glycosyl transferase family 90, partial [Rhabdochlamydiaceae bacterium]